MIGALLGLVCGIALGRIFTPDDFAADWYGWLTNQLGHTLSMLGALGFVIVGAAMWFEVPTQWQLATNGAAFCAAFQLVQWYQGGTISDSVQDAVFMAYGWIPACYLFKVGPDDLPKLQSLTALAACLSVVSLHLCYGVARRWK